MARATKPAKRVAPKAQAGARDEAVLPRAALDALPLAFALFDAKGGLLAWNARLADLKLFPKRLLRTGTALKEFRVHDKALASRAAKPRDARLSDGRVLCVTATRVGAKQLLVTWEDVTQARLVAERLDSVTSASPHGTAVRDASGRAIRMVGSTADVDPLKKLKQALAESEERYALATQAATEGIYDWNVLTGSFFLSERAKAFFAIRGMKQTPAAWNSSIHAEDFTGYRDAIVRFFKSRTTRFEHEYRIRNAKGGYRWVADNAVAVRDTARRVQRMVGAISDIDARKNAEFALQRAHAETRETLERQTATAEILKVIAGSPDDVQPVFEAIVENAARLTAPCSCGINMLEGDRIVFRAGAGLKSTPEQVERMRALFPIPHDPNRNLASRAIAEGRVLQADPVAAGMPEIAKAVSEVTGARSITQIPLMRGGAGIGTLTVRSDDPDFRLSERQLAVMLTFAGQAVIAIENVRLFNETKEALERQTATAEILKVISASPTDTYPVFEAIVHSAKRLIGAKDSALIMRRATDGYASATTEATREQLEGASEDFRSVTLDRNRNYPSRVILDGELIELPDTQADSVIPHEQHVARIRGWGSELQVPLLRKGEGIGALIVGREATGSFSEREIALLQSFADQAVIAIENVRLFNETKESLERQTATAEVLKVIAGSPDDVQPVFDSIAESALRLIGGRSAMVARREGDMLHLASATTTNPAGDGALRQSFPTRLTGQAPVGRAIQTGKPVAVGDVGNDPSITESTREIARARGTQGIVAVPMIREGSAIGAIAVTRGHVAQFTDHEISLLQTFADQAVIAIENVRLFNETREALERQTATAEILKVIAASPTDVQPVFEAIVRSASRLFGCGTGITVREGNVIDLKAIGDSKMGESTLAATFKDMKAHFPIPFDPQSGTTSRVIATCLAEETADTEAPGMPESARDMGRQGGYRSIMHMPLARSGVGIGVLSLAFEKPNFRLDDKQRALLQTFADQAVIAIENVRLFNETKEALEQQTATADILGIMSRSPGDVQPVLDAICAKAVELFPPWGASIHLYEDGMLHFNAIRVTVFSDQQLEQFRSMFPIRPDPRTNLQLRALREQRVIEIPDVLAADIPADAARRVVDLGLRSVVHVPMVREGQGVGVISLGHSEPTQRLNERQLALMRTFADQAVIAIENVRLFNETKEALAHQTAAAQVLQVISNSVADTQPVFEQILDCCEALMSNDDVIIDTLGEDGMLQLRAHRGLHAEGVANAYPVAPPELTPTYLARGVVSYADMMHGEDVPQRIRDAAHASGNNGSLIEAAMLSRGRLIGTITAARMDLRGYTTKEETLLKTFADQAVIAIENARLFNETKEALERQTATADVLKVISESPTDTQPVFDAIAESAARLCEAADCSIFRREENRLLPVAHHGPLAPPEQIGAFHILIRRESVAGQSVLDRRTIHITDIQAAADEFPSTAEATRPMGFRTMLNVPLMREGVAIGVIQLPRAEVRPFSDRQIALLETFADQAVIAIENVRLFNETKEALERQTATAEILKVISESATDTQPVFDAIVRSASRLFECNSAIFMREESSVHLRSLFYGDRRSDTKDRDEVRKLFPVPFDPEHNFASLAMASARIVDVADTLADDALPLARRVGQLINVRAMTFVPLLREGVPIGSIGISRVEPGRFLSDEQHALLQTFADQAVIAIENVRLFRELDARNRDVSEALERQTATAEILRIISESPTDTRPVFYGISRSAARLFDAGAAVTLVKGDQIDVAAMARPDSPAEWTDLDGIAVGVLSGRSETEVAAIRTVVRRNYPQPLDPGRSLTARAIAARETQVFPDIDVPEFPEHHRNLARAIGFQALSVVPLIREGSAIGAINLSFTERGKVLDDKQRALVQTFADQAVIAIENVRLFNETKEALERQTATAEILKVISESPTDVQPVFNAIAKSAARLIGLGARAGIAMREGDLVHLKAIATKDDLDADRAQQMFEAMKAQYPRPYDPERHLGSKVMESRVSLEVDDTEAPGVPELVREIARSGGYRSIAMVPLLREGSGIGLIAVSFEQPGVRLNDNQRALLQTFAGQAVIAIENVRLFNETKEALERQTATAEILKVISESPTDVQPVFDAIVESATLLFNARVGISIRDGDWIDLKAVALSDVNPETKEHLFAEMKQLFPMQFDPERSIQARVIATLEPAECADTEAEGVPEIAREMARRGGYRAFYSVPLVRENTGIGVLATAFPQPGIRFDDKQKALLRTFADQAVIAIENVRLFNELQDRTAALTKSVGQLTALGEVSQTLSSTLDLDKVLATIVSRAVQLTGLDGGALYEYDEAQGIFLLRGGENLREEVVELNRAEPIRMGDGFIGQAAATRSPVQVPDLAAAPQRTRGRDVLLGIGFRALLAVPLVREGHVLGALAVARNTTGEFAPEVIALLQTFATQSAIAIQNARLFREIEAKSRQLEEASQHKSQFLASMSHELRTPLNAILGFNELILGEIYGEVPEDMKAPLEQTQSSGKHLLGLINNVLDLAKIEANRMELALADYAVQDLVSTARATLAPLAQAKGLAFDAIAPEDLPLGYGDSGRLAQCLINLAGNAIKFTKEGSVRIAVEAAGEQLRFSVADTGMGIAPDKIAELFTEFKQTDATIAREYGGTGLGLAITKKFIELHGGTIRVESTLGQGSDFIFEIPLRAQPS